MCFRGIYIYLSSQYARNVLYLLKILISSINFAYIRLLSDIIHHRHTKRNDLQTSYKINYLQLHATCIRIEISGGKIRPRIQSRILPEIIRCIQPRELSTKAIPRRRWWRFPSRFPLLTQCRVILHRYYARKILITRELSQKARFFFSFRWQTDFSVDSSRRKFSLCCLRMKRMQYACEYACA